MTDRSQTSGEELANSISHGVVLLAAIAASPVLIMAAMDLGTASVVGAAIFAATMVGLYLASTLYHAMPPGRTKNIFRKVDHGAIYLFIAGSYTPFALGALRGPWGWTLIGLVWSLAAMGVTLKVFNRIKRPWLSTGLYLAMGWLVVIAIVPLMERVHPMGLALLVGGGLAYTLGVVFYVMDSRWRYAHAIWHGFVAAGTGFHFFAILKYAA